MLFSDSLSKSMIICKDIIDTKELVELLKKHLKIWYSFVNSRFLFSSKHTEICFIGVKNTKKLIPHFATTKCFSINTAQELVEVVTKKCQ